MPKQDPANAAKPGHLQKNFGLNLPASKERTQRVTEKGKATLTLAALPKVVLDWKAPK